MEKISLIDFKNYCSKIQVHKYIFDTDNQLWDKFESTIRSKVEFSTMRITFNPNTVFLRSGTDFIKFERVKYIIFNEKSLLGTVFTFVCGNKSDTIKDVFYTIIVQ